MRNKCSGGFIFLIRNCLLALLFISGPVFAEDAADTANQATAEAKNESTPEIVYVIDRLLAGVYKSKALRGEPLELVPTSSSLTVLERNEKTLKVRTGDGMEGWVDVNYIMLEKPSELLLEEKEAAYEQILQQLHKAEGKLHDLESKVSQESILKAVETPSSFMTGGHWALLIFCCLLASVLGGYIAYLVLRYRFFLVER